MKPTKNTVTMPAVSFTDRFGELIAKADALNLADVNRAGTPGRESLNKSLSFFCQASGVPADQKLTVEESKSWKRAHMAFQAAYAETQGIRQSEAGHTVVVSTRYGKIDKVNHLPSVRTVSSKTVFEMNRADQAAFAADEVRVQSANHARLVAEIKAMAEEEAKKQKAA